MASPVFGVIAPHPPIFVEGVGGTERLTASKSLNALAEVAQAIESFGPQTIVIMSPHAPALLDGFAVDGSEQFAGDLSQFGDARIYRWAGDPALAAAIRDELGQSQVPVVDRTSEHRLIPGELDHGVLVPLSFLDPEMRYRLVVVSLSGLPLTAHREFGAALRAAVTSLDRRVVFVASGDLSHRLKKGAPAGYSPRAAELDAAIVGRVEQGRLDALTRLDPELVEAGGECGLRSFVALGGYCCEDPAPTCVLSYEGPWGVGYLTALVGRAAIDAYDRRRLNGDPTPRVDLDDRCSSGADTPTSGHKGGQPGSAESEIVALARTAIVAYLTGRGATRDVVLTDPAYPARAGAFVSLHRGGELRGCIGTILPTKESLAAEVVANAIEAAVHDPRFPPLSELELGDLDVKVDVLHEPESCTLDDLDPSSYGVIASNGWRRGLLLPDLEGVDDVQTQVRIATQKAGIRPGEPCSYERFKVDRYT